MLLLVSLAFRESAGTLVLLPPVGAGHW